MPFNHRYLRQIHRWFAPIMVLPMLLTLLTGSLFQVAVLKGESQKFLWLLSLGAVIITSGVGAGIYTAVNPSPANTLSPEALQITSYRSPNCGCCHGWVEHLKAEGFTVKDNVTENLETIKTENNVPQNLTACHTAVINGYKEKRKFIKNIFND